MRSALTGAMVPGKSVTGLFDSGKQGREGFPEVLMLNLESEDETELTRRAREERCGKSCAQPQRMGCCVRPGGGGGGRVCRLLWLERNPRAGPAPLAACCLVTFP